MAVCVLTGVPGAEDILCAEAAALVSGAARVRRGELRGTVEVEGPLDDLYRASLGSWTASRALVPVGSFELNSFEQFEEGVRALRWEDHLRLGKTFAVDTYAGPGWGQQPHFVALKTKDAIVDRLRAKLGARPDIDPKQPDVQVFAHLGPKRATLSVVLFEETAPLRGIMRGSLASTILALAGWPEAAAENRPLVDPWCGRGVLLTEAVRRALGRAPERLMDSAPGWSGHIRTNYQRVRDGLRDRMRPLTTKPLMVYGFDPSALELETAQRLLGLSKLDRFVTLERANLAQLAPPPKTSGGLLISAPPGPQDRETSGEFGPLYEQLGDSLKRRFGGWCAWLYAENQALPSRLGLRPSQRLELRRGAIEARLLEVPISALKGPTGEAATKGAAPRAQAPTVAARPSVAAPSVVASSVVAPGEGASGVAGEPSVAAVVVAPVAAKAAVKPSEPEHVGPSWRKPSEAGEMLANRVRKNVKKLEAWLKREGVTCYRAYDADIPEYNLALDVYGGAVHVQEYARPKTVDPKLAEQRLRDAVLLAPSLFGVKPEDVFLKVRRRSPEDAPALPKVGEDMEVTEGGLKFWVNLADHLDTGLFLDHRSVRAWLRSQAKERDFLNLFAYTSTATVYAAAGGAKSSVSVDLSRAYLEWGRRNMALNGLDGPQHRFESEDVGEWLQRDERKFDLIFAAPPIYSRSKRAEEFDVQRDHVTLIELAMARLRPGGVLLFSNPLQSFKLDQEALAAYRPEDLSSKLLPPDFARNPRIHATWKFQR